MSETYEATVITETANGSQSETFTDLAAGDVENIRRAARELAGQGDTVTVTVREV